MQYQDKILALLDNKQLGERPNKNKIAKSLNISERTLSRRLNQENTHYKQLIDEYLMNRTLPIVLSKQHSIEDISSMFGYSSAGAFIKAFYRWTGDTPANYRSKQ